MSRHKFAARRGSDADSDVEDVDELDAELNKSLTQLPPIDVPFQPRSKQEMDDDNEDASERATAADCSAEFEMLNRLTHTHVPNQNELIVENVQMPEHFGSGSGSGSVIMTQTVSNPSESANRVPGLKDLAERYVTLKIWSQSLREVDKALNAKAMQILPLIATRLPSHSRPLITRDQHLIYQVVQEKKAASVDPKLTDEILAKIMPKMSDEDKEAIKRHPKRLMPIRLNVLTDVLGKERGKEPWKRAKAYATKKAPGGAKKYTVRIIPHPEEPGIIMPPSETEADKRLSRAFLNDPIGFNGLIKAETIKTETKIKKEDVRDTKDKEPLVMVKQEKQSEQDSGVKQEKLNTFADTSRRPPMKVFYNDPNALSGAIDLCNAMDTHQSENGARQQFDHMTEAAELVQTFSSESIVCFTDGGASPNPGFCGAGAVICVPTTFMKLEQVLKNQDTWDEAWKGLGRGTNNIAELSAIELALDVLDEMQDTIGREFKAPAIHILTDSTYANGVLSGTMIAKANADLVKQIKKKIANRSKTSPVTIHWVKGHAGVPGNERADQLATRGIEISVNLKTTKSKCLKNIRTVDRILQEERQANLSKMSSLATAPSLGKPSTLSSPGPTTQPQPQVQVQDEFEQMRRAFAQTMPKAPNTSTIATATSTTTVAVPASASSSALSTSTIYTNVSPNANATSISAVEPRIAALTSVKVPQINVATGTEKNSANEKDANAKNEKRDKKHKRKRERSSSPESSAASDIDDESDNDKSKKVDKKKSKKSKKRGDASDDDGDSDDQSSNKKQDKSKNKKSRTKTKSKKNKQDMDSSSDSDDDDDDKEPRRKKAKVDKKESIKDKKSSTRDKTKKKHKKQRADSSDSGSDSD